MYCNECGKKNPDTAKFCAYCGAKLLDDDAAAVMDDAPAWEAESRFDAGTHRDNAEWQKPPMHPDESATAPVQPSAPVKKAMIAPESSVWSRREETPAEPVKRRRDDIVRADHSRPEDSPWSRPENTLQARRAAHQGAPSTIVPLRGQEKEPVHDLFFEGYDSPAPVRRAPVPRRRKPPKPSFFEQNLRGILGIGLTLGTLLVLAVWLFLFPSGQQMLARFGMTDNPKAYAAIAQNAYEMQNYSTAAQNYYQALVLDGDNYDYALKTADSYEKAGQKGAASTALTMAIEINASDLRAYRMLQQLYPDAATRPAAVTELLNQGATLTGDVSLTN